MPADRFGHNRFAMAKALRTELAITYDAAMFPISARCTHCGVEIPLPESRLPAAEIILWFSVRFLEHKKLEHPDTCRRVDDDDADPVEEPPT